jgi:hypothetical protein
MKLLRSFFGLFIVFAALYSGWKVLPPYWANFQLEDSFDDSARSAGTPGHHRSDDELRQEAVQDARALGIQLAPEQIQIERVPGDVLLWADYTVRVDLPLHPFDLHFQPMSKSKKRAS